MIYAPVRVLGVDAGVDRVDIVQHLVGTAAAHELHGRLAREARPAAPT